MVKEWVTGQNFKTRPLKLRFKRILGLRVKGKCIMQIVFQWLLAQNQALQHTKTFNINNEIYTFHFHFLKIYDVVELQI